jgi:predicted nucleotidyltransferase
LTWRDMADRNIGKEREDLIRILRDYFQNRSIRYSVDMAFLYGSFARGFPRPDSDIDIAVVFSEEPFSEDDSFERITDISVSLSKELKREVNLIQIHRDSRKPLLYYNAVVLGVPVYIGVRENYIALRNEAIHQMEDFSIFGIPWQYKVARKNLEAIGHA